MGSSAIVVMAGAQFAMVAAMMLLFVLPPHHSAVAQLSHEDKQLLLDVHNYHRAAVNAANMRQIVWSTKLEEEAQKIVESCDVVVEARRNVAYNTSAVDEESTSLGDIVDYWLDSKQSDFGVARAQQPILWFATKMMGCANFLCPRLSAPGGERYSNAYFTACVYDPRFFSSEDGSLFIDPSPLTCNSQSGRCRDPDRLRCVKFQSGDSEQLEEVDSIGKGYRAGLYCADSDEPALVPEEDEEEPPPTRRVTRMSPLSGSVAGGTRITLSGTGFSGNQLDGGNRVTFVNQQDERDIIECDILIYHTGQNQIVCDTRPAKNLEGDTRYNVRVQVNDGSGKGFEDIEVCSWCTYLYNLGFWTPIVRNIEPSAGTFGDVLKFQGYFYASSFGDPDEENEADVYLRVLVGGRGCDPNDANQTEYGLTFNEVNKRDASVKCMPENTFAIESSNVTLILGRRGNSHVPLSSNILSVDNKLQPYTFQTHADILNVSPSSGSAEGGTTIFITVNAPLANYTMDAIKVIVGGQPCRDVYVVESGARESTIQCVTPPKPSPRTYYPGERGVQREVFFTGNININLVSQQPRSMFTSIVDKFFIYSYVDTPEFGESTYFTQRFSGFFVPPMSSVYTFNIHSDDLSRMYFSPNASSEYLGEPIISIPQWTRFRWDFFPQQFSDPVYLEAGKYYYFEVISNQGGGPWDIGLAAKIHSLNHTTYPYQGDRERQRIEIRSNVVRENIGISVRALPAVKEIRFYPSFVPNDNTNVSCPTTVVFTFTEASGETTNLHITLSPFDKPKDVEDKLYTSLQNAGIKSRIHVFVDFFGDMDNQDVGVKFQFVILNPLERMSYGVPDVTVDGDQSQISCVNLNNETNLIPENLLNVRVEISTIQNQTFPNNFKIGYENLTMMPGMRFTDNLPVNVSATSLEDAIYDLFGWGCTNQPSASLLERISFYQSYESSEHDNRDIRTSFCGHASVRDPRRIWEVNTNNAFDIGNSPFYVCFAYKGSFPGLSVRASFDLVDPNTNIIVSSGYRTIKITDCVELDNTPTDDWAEHQCFDLRSCLVDMYDNRVLHNLKFRWLGFGNNANFWVDEFLLIDTSMTGLANFEVARDTSKPRLSLSDVIIESVEVVGETLDIPILVPLPDSGSGSGSGCSGSGSSDGSGIYPEEYENACNQTKDTESDPDGQDEPKFIMILSEFNVLYSVLDCGFGLPQPSGYYQVDSYTPMTARVDIKQVEAASLPVSGNFSVTVGETTLTFPYDVTAEQLKNLLSVQLPDEGGFDVTRSGSCTGYSWELSWQTKGGDQPLVGVYGGELVGSNVSVVTVPILDGGTWIRPVGGDMLRVPREQPQVEVIINDIPSSCRQGVCNFNYSESETPRVEAIYPAEGQGGAIVTLYGSGFSNVVSDIDIVIGNAPCQVTDSNDTVIQCVVSNHTAGWYKVKAKIEGKGNAFINDSVCFRYLLSVAYISSSSGGVGGGETITIMGNGFMPFENHNNTEFGIEISSLPWFHSGIGLPCFRNMRYMNLCPGTERELRARDQLLDEFTPNSVIEAIYDIDSFEPLNQSDPMREDYELTREGRFNVESFHAHLFNIYLRFPAFVLVGGVPCIITESTVMEINCVPAINLPQVANVSVVVLTEKVHLENAYEIDVNETIFVESIEPSEGAVVGRTQLTIIGYDFKAYSSEDVTVYVGMEQCEVSSANSTHILCYIPSMGPSMKPVYVLTPAGVAVWKTALEEQLQRNELESSGVGELPMNDEVDLSPFPVFTYKLEVIVDPSTPYRGSSFGGTLVTLTGGVFVMGYTQVSVGGIAAEIVSMNETEINFFTPTSTRTHYIRLLHSQLKVDNTVDLYWNQTDITIQVGDTVEWDWNIRIPGYSTFSFEVFQTADNESMNSIADGFQSAQSSSSLSVTFDEPGMFNYIGNTITPRFGVPVRGIVRVSEPRMSSGQINVTVGGFEAKFIREEQVSSGTGVVRRRRETGRLEPSMDLCEEEMQMNTASSDGITFIYSGCNTPSVSYVTPQVGYGLSTVFTISGSLFSKMQDLNVVEFDNFTCEVVNSSTDEIKCMLSQDTTPASFTPLDLSLKILDPSKGTAYIRDRSTTMIEIKPVIHDISPMEGSVEGGTDVVITGEGFKCPDGDMLKVTIGDLPCDVKAYGYTELECTTVAVDAPVQLNLSVWCGSSDKSAMCVSGCSYSYSTDRTPMVTTVTPSTYSGNENITIDGSGFAEQPEDNSITVGGEYTCSPIMASSSQIVCSLPALPAKSYELSLKVCNISNDRCFGYASISDSASVITSIANLTSVSPMSGSVAGGTALTIVGTGFSSDISSITVTIGGQQCEVRFANYSTIMCLTSANDVEGTYSVNVAIEGLSSFPSDSLSYNYSMLSTPVVSGITPTNGQRGDMVTISGSGFGSDPSSITVDFDGTGCDVNSSLSREDTIFCILGNHFVGIVAPEVVVEGMGNAMTQADVLFDFDLVAGTPSDSSGSFAGMNTITVPVDGADPSQTTITICGEECNLSPDVIPSESELACIVPPVEFISMQLMSCNITIQSGGESVDITNGYQYDMNLTPVVDSINRTRGGTEGGSPIMISGQGFMSPANVTIAGSVCDVIEQTETTIICVTNRSGRTVQAPVMVWIDGKGFAISNITFWYIDLWSSPFTWGGGPLPQEGEFVVIPRGQTLLLDTHTPILSYLLIQGGELIFDPEKGDNEVSLHTQGGLITSGGRLQIGTEEEPFLAKTEVVLYGHFLSIEIPVYGAKTLALREGVIDMHGRPINVTWTRLAKTVEPGENQIELQEYVDWEVGGKIVIASTSFSQRENEEHTIAGISAGTSGTILTLSDPMEYQHISVQQTIAGRYIDTSGEVGYLTRNIVIRGNKNADWIGQVDACEREFLPGQFDVQSCFLGRFGPETLSDQFGSQIMIHGPEVSTPEKQFVLGRFEYIEVTHAGQAFRLGRYPIHFHLNGNVSGSYVRGCGIHNTFNRAVTVHAVDYLLVEKNVAYNIMGHAFFLEDGNEKHNIIQDNLGIFIRGSSSLLNVDITPATFWVVNPMNTVRRNAAAGGTHFGFWYRMTEHPTGPSFDANICPRKIRVQEFSDNSAHSFGWYGLWIFQFYYPTLTGECDDNQPGPSYYDRFLSWRNDRGVEFSEIGSIQLRDSIMLDNNLAGVEYTELSNTEWGEEGPYIKNTLIVSHSMISEVQGEDEACTAAGIRAPHSYFLSVSDVTFVNFDRSGCFPIQACSHCREFQGGFETRYKNITYINAGSNQLTQWMWTHEHVHRDMDGTLTQSSSPQLLIPTNGLLDPSQCQVHPGSSMSGVGGSICNGNLEFGRVAISNPSPDSLTFGHIELTNDHGTDELVYAMKRLRGDSGYMAQLAYEDSYQLRFLADASFTNISYSLILSGFEPDDYIIFNQPYPRELDSTLINGISGPVNASDFKDPASLQSGNWFIGDNNTLNYILKGDPNNEEPSLTFATFRCFYDGCEPPPPPPPPTLPPPEPRCDNVQRWSEPSTWPNGEPKDGDNVFINRSQCILVDTEIPRLGMLLIEGDLELEDSLDHVIEADLIIINGGALIAGSEENPFVNKAKFILHGNTSSSEFRFNDLASPPVGAKAIGVFGQLILHSRVPDVTWTFLAATAEKDDTVIQVYGQIDGWQPDDFIVITSTSYNAFETEVVQIDSISGNSITLKTALQYKHAGGSESIGPSGEFYYRAEVGLLTRRISIENGESAFADQEAFGCRVLVSSNANYLGTAQLQGVEFSGCGQLGYTEHFDPRFALAFLNIGRQIGTYASYVKSCSFHDGYNTAIGVFLSSNMMINDNVIYGTVGDSVIITGSDHVINHNLASLSQFLGTYRDRDEPLNDLWTANFELSEATDFEFMNNAAAGGAKAGIHTHGEQCIENSPITMRNNIVHSTLHGVHLGYADGHKDCSRFNSFTIFNCYHYGFFSYSGAGIHIIDSVFINNKAAVYVTVIGPSSTRHIVGMKSVDIEKTLIVSASGEFDCTEDQKVPAIANHQTSHRGLQSPSGGHVGIIAGNFYTGPGHFPKAAWFSVISYPAINGITRISEVTFINFQKRCTVSERQLNDVVVLVSPGSEDANHPVHFQSIQFGSEQKYQQPVDPELRVFVREPNLGRVNPSDCVDMDCDGHKQVVMKDLDGSFTEMPGSQRTIISVAEFEWDGDPRRGLGDYRIPRTMLTYPNNGSRIPINDIYPKKGIIRGRDFGSESDCSYMETWNTYLCSRLDHLMLVMESLDEDTEVRRLSPIGIGANGFINLVNGPMDNGWCGGYTCQERLSIFYTIVAAGFDYSIALTSTNPQDYALHLLQSDESQGIRAGIIYTNPQGLDVYIVDDRTREETFIPPTNTERDADGNIQFLDRDPTKPRNQFIPTLADNPGTNFYDRDTRQLYIIIKGNYTYKIRTRPVIMLSLTLQVSLEEFFDEENLVRNLALLLGIPNNKIRIVNVVRETQNRRKRQDSEMQTIDFEIGNQPGEEVVTATPGNVTEEVNETTTTAAPDGVTLSLTELVNVAERAAEVVQTGEITQSLNNTVSVVSAAIEEPEPPPVDPTGGVRATPETGGPQPIADANGTILNFFELQNRTDAPMTYDELVREREENETAANVPVVLSVPTTLVTLQGFVATVIEGVAIASNQGPQFAMHDSNGERVMNLGLEIPWEMTVIVTSGPAEGFLRNERANFTQGVAQFDRLIFSHPGEYQLTLRVTYPQMVDFSAAMSLTVMPRRLALQVTQQPQNGNTTFSLYPQPTVQLQDRDTNELITEHDWRNLTWFVTAYAIDTSYVWEVELNSGVAVFMNVSIGTPGTYRLRFEAHTVPTAPFGHLPQTVTSEQFTIVTLPITKLNITYEVDFNSTIGGDESGFIEMFKSVFAAAFPDVKIGSIEISEGSIIVTIEVVADTPQTLVSFVSQVMANNGASLAFVFNSMPLVPSNVTQDPDFIIVLPPDQEDEDQLVLILATTIPAGTVLIVGILVIVIAYFCMRRKKQTQSFKIKVKPATNVGAEERYIRHDHKAAQDDSLSNQSSMDEYYLLPEQKKIDAETKSFEYHELSEFNSAASTPASERKIDIVTSTEIEVPGAFFVNPGARKEKGDIECLSDLEGNIDEMWNKASETNSNNNNSADVEAGLSLPNMVPSSEPISVSRPGTAASRPGTTTSRPGTAASHTSRPGTGSRVSQKLDDMIVEDM